jgi:hypothetical protein
MCALCGHSFCKECFNDWLGRNNTCPECRTKVNKKNVHRDLTASKFLDEQRVRCNFRGCAWDGRLDHLVSHLKECEFDPERVPAWMVQNSDDGEGVSSLRMRLFKNRGTKRALEAAAEGDDGILAI